MRVGLARTLRNQWPVIVAIFRLGASGNRGRVTAVARRSWNVTSTIPAGIGTGGRGRLADTGMVWRCPRLLRPLRIPGEKMTPATAR